MPCPKRRCHLGVLIGWNRSEGSDGVRLDRQLALEERERGCRVVMWFAGVEQPSKSLASSAEGVGNDSMIAIPLVRREYARL